MEGFPSRFPPPACGWEKKEGRLMTLQGINYLEVCKAILAQVHHPPPPPHPSQRKVTREFGVQVNARVDKIVQCSLGPKTLYFDEASSGSSPLSPVSPTSPPSSSSPRTPALETPPVNSLRFLRPVSIYSPVFDRWSNTRRLGEEEEEDEEGGEEEEEQQQQEEEEVTQEEAEGGDKAEEAVNYYKAALDGPLKGPNFQFLEQRYGFFHCKKCNIRWESAYVWCISGTNKVYYKQLCRKCQVGFNPFRVESIICKGCSQTSCCCDKKQRHINMRRPHRQDLCCRCKGMRLSCDATYSFKYIV